MLEISEILAFRSAGKSGCVQVIVVSVRIWAALKRFLIVVRKQKQQTFDMFVTRGPQNYQMNVKCGIFSVWIQI